MATGFFPLKINKVNRETKDAVSIYFDIPEHLQSQFKYLPGQYLNFSVIINGEEVRRAYSLCTSPYTDVVPGIAVKAVEGGKMSTYLNTEVKQGDVIEVMPPLGKFTANIDAANSKHYVLIGGGSGITPLMAILKSVLTQEPNSKVTLVYANRDMESIIFGDAINELQNQYGSRLTIIHSLDTPPAEWSGMSGFLTAEKVKNIATGMPGGSSAHYYICGPTPMMDIAKQGLADGGIPADHVNTEYFTSPTSEKKEETVPVEEGDLPPLEEDTKAKVNVYGSDHEIEVEAGQTILEAAMDADLDPPYSCQAGVCTTCRARLLSGKVVMDEREGLSDAEIEEGFILTCQSRVCTTDVSVRFE